MNRTATWECQWVCYNCCNSCEKLNKGFFKKFQCHCCSSCEKNEQKDLFIVVFYLHTVNAVKNHAIILVIGILLLLGWCAGSIWHLHASDMRFCHLAVSHCLYFYSVGGKGGGGGGDKGEVNEYKRFTEIIPNLDICFCPHSQPSFPFLFSCQLRTFASLLLTLDWGVCHRPLPPTPPPSHTPLLKTITPPSCQLHSPPPPPTTIFLCQCAATPPITPISKHVPLGGGGGDL